MTTPAQQPPTFPWDFTKPPTPFWTSLPWKVARNFYQSFPPSTQSTLESRLAPHATLPFAQRLELLITILSTDLPNSEISPPPQDSTLEDYKRWNGTLSGITTILDELGRRDEALRINRLQAENATPPNSTSPNLSAKHSLSQRLLSAGQFSESETCALEVLDWINELEGLGPDAPQALAMHKVLIQTAWKSGRRDVAEERIRMARGVVVRMGGGRFAKYEEDEGEGLEDVVKGLEGWEGG